MSKVEPHNNSTIFEPLLKLESSVMFFLSEPAIFPYNARLKERLSLICKANPWIAGRLVKNQKINKNLLLAIPQSVAEEDVDALICKDEDGSLSDIGIETPYEEICDKLLKSKMVVGRGYKLVGKELRCSKFSLVKAAQGVALIVSITHTIADGHTYYKIMSMLQMNGDVQELSPTRKHDFVTRGEEAIGPKDYKYLLGIPFGLCCMKGMLCGSNAKLDARWVDKDKVKKLKGEAKVGFISTNDILTSAFSRVTRSDLLLMAINLRNRVNGTDDMDAGNYSLVLVHDKESSASPSYIRQSLKDGPPFKRKGDTPLPGFFNTVRAKASMITNWAFQHFEADLALAAAHGGSTVPLGLHLPIPYHPKDIAFPIAVIFRPCKGKLGILYGGSAKHVSSDRLIDAGAPIGEKISTGMFPN